MPGGDQGVDSADDSRTAAVGPRNRQKLNRVAKQSSQCGRGGRHPGKNRRARRQDPQDFVPRGAAFTNASLPVDGDSSSDQASDDCASEYITSESESALGQPHSKVKMQQQQQQPAVNWNKVAGRAIRTSLRGSGGTSTPVSGSFDTVNEKYWRSRSASASEHENLDSSKPNANARDVIGGLERTPNGSTNAMLESEDSDLESDAEADKSIMLNLSTPNQQDAMMQENTNGGPEPSNPYPNGANGTQTTRKLKADSVIEQQQQQTVSSGAHSRDQSDAAKTAAFESFDSRYPSAPCVLADLTRGDRDLQMKYIYYNVEPKDIDLNLPIRCTDCMAEGHLSDICPNKECNHCGAWGVHESKLCPSWRRCQRCRERGHDEPDCPSLLKALASEVPCDFCGSSQHIESDCDLLWKLPKRDLSLSQIFISVCCSFCTSNNHLLGDCPNRPFPMDSSSWSLSAVDPSLISNLAGNMLPVTMQNTNRDEQLSGLRIKGRANEYPESDEENDDFIGSNRWKPLNKQPPRAHIRFGSGIGRGGNISDDRQNENGRDRYIPQDHGRDYRDRDQFSNRNARLRSLSPDPRHPRQQGGGSGRYQPPRSPPRGRGRAPPPPSRGGNKTKRGGPGTGRGGRGAKSADNRDVYRPLPSAAKRAWDKHRL